MKAIGNQSKAKGGGVSRNELNALLAAVLVTALECEATSTPVPESMAYLAMGSDMGKWEVVKGFLYGGGLATFGGSQVNLTDKGRAVAVQCQAAAAGAAA